jgi:hypothetical protein
MQPTTRRGPGRPRDPEVAARDERIYRLLAHGPASRKALAEQAGLDRDTVYLSLQRLRRDNRVRQCLVNGGIVWTTTNGTPCP